MDALSTPCIFCGSDRPLADVTCPSCGRGWIDARISEPSQDAKPAPATPPLAAAGNHRPGEPSEPTPSPGAPAEEDPEGREPDPDDSGEGDPGESNEPLLDPDPDHDSGDGDPSEGTEPTPSIGSAPAGAGAEAITDVTSTGADFGGEPTSIFTVTSFAAFENEDEDADEPPADESEPEPDEPGAADDTGETVQADAPDTTASDGNELDTAIVATAMENITEEDSSRDRTPEDRPSSAGDAAPPEEEGPTTADPGGAQAPQDVESPSDGASEEPQDETGPTAPEAMTADTEPEDGHDAAADSDGIDALDEWAAAGLVASPSDEQQRKAADVSAADEPESSDSRPGEEADVADSAGRSRDEEAHAEALNDAATDDAAQAEGETPSEAVPVAAAATAAAPASGAPSELRDTDESAEDADADGLQALGDEMVETHARGAGPAGAVAAAEATKHDPESSDAPTSEVAAAPPEAPFAAGYAAELRKIVDEPDAADLVAADDDEMPTEDTTPTGDTPTQVAPPAPPPPEAAGSEGAESEPTTAGGGMSQRIVVVLTVLAVIAAWFVVLAWITREDPSDAPEAITPTTAAPTTAAPESTDAPGTTNPPSTTAPPSTTTTTIPVIDAIGDAIPIEDLGMGASALGPLEFGSNEALGRLVATFGQPDTLTPATEAAGVCADDLGFVSTWGPLSGVFLGTVGESTFVAYRNANQPGHPAADLATLSGLEVGDTVADLQSVYSGFNIAFREVDGTLSFILVSNSDGATLLWGPVSSSEPDGIVEGINSPRSCDAGPSPSN